MSGISRLIIDFSGCDALEMRLKERNRHYRSEMIRGKKLAFRMEVIPEVKNEPSEIFPGPGAKTDLEKLCAFIIQSLPPSSLSGIVARGSFWIGDTAKELKLPASSPVKLRGNTIRIGGEYKSLLIIPFTVGIKDISLILFKSKKANFFGENEIPLYEGIAQNLGVALVHRHTQVALRERVKEFTCLYGIAKIVACPDISLKEILQNTVELLPPAWLYPEITTARITVDRYSCRAPGFAAGVSRLTAEIIVNEITRGRVEVIYKKEKPKLDEGPFLREERNLIDTVAQKIALVLERRQAEEDRAGLQEQLRHADRLATIGQLAAGVAHELNEPLGSILGFAQLSRRNSGLPQEVDRDLQKIINASLHAREIIKKLMVFARQMPPRKTAVSLNQIVEEGIYFLESRCAKSGIELVRKFLPALPEITADPSQLHQVLINLIVNAIQAMPKGGKLTLETLAKDGQVVLIVRDTGTGMNKDVLKKIFTPFFTTKDVHEGTGLGLSVVHGIITSHGGSIKVESRIGAGARFEIQLPIKGFGATKENEQNGKDS
ncbi:MAG: ATP-binding protein [candidate division Zixibacteria bacterium]|nr:ATP-binding protein [candidate division Zixibacteria bacterium]